MYKFIGNLQRGTREHGLNRSDLSRRAANKELPLGKRIRRRGQFLEGTVWAEREKSCLNKRKGQGNSKNDCKKGEAEGNRKALSYPQGRVKKGKLGQSTPVGKSARKW